MIHLLHWKNRSLIYSLILAIGFGIYTFSLSYNNPQYSMIIAGVTALIFLLELITTIWLGKSLLEQYKLPPIDNHDKFANLIQHFVLPISLFVSLISFLFFHQYLVVKYVFVAISFFAFWILFANIRAYYEDKFKIEIRTHYIYDLVSILTFFGLIDSFSNFVNYTSTNLILYYLGLSLIIVVFYALVIIRLRIFDIRNILLAALISNLGFVMVFNALNLITLKLSFISTLMYYFFIAYANHHRENTKSMKVFEEYIVLLLIAIVLLIFN
jgi:hypothetical protein